MSSNEKFWLQDPMVLLKCRLLPTNVMTITEKLNALTRLIILTSIAMYLMNYEQYTMVIVFGLLLVVILHGFLPKEEFRSEITNTQALEKGIRSFVPGYDSRPHVPPTSSCWFNPDRGLLNAAFEITPPIQFNHYDDAKRSYMNAKYELTPLTDMDGFKDIWRSEPEMCGGYSMVPDPVTVFPVAAVDTPGQCNYIVRSKIDHLPISQTQNDLASTRPIAEEAYLNSMIDFRNGIMNEHIDRFTRERKHNCPDMKLYPGNAGAGGSI